jgi:hypothetical protein
MRAGLGLLTLPCCGLGAEVLTTLVGGGVTGGTALDTNTLAEPVILGGLGGVVVVVVVVGGLVVVVVVVEVVEVVVEGVVLNGAGVVVVVEVVLVVVVEVVGAWVVVVVVDETATACTGMAFSIMADDASSTSFAASQVSSLKKWTT